MILGQDDEHFRQIKLGTISFRGGSSKLTKEARLILDSFVTVIQINLTAKVQAVAYNKDLCSVCGDRSWRRATEVLKYLSKHGVCEDRLTFTNSLEGDFNKVDIFLVSEKYKDISAYIIK